MSAQAYAAGSINLSDINLKNLGSKQIITAFTQSKLALILMTRYMAKLLKGLLQIFHNFFTLHFSTFRHKGYD